MNCDRCGRQIQGNESHSHAGQTLCDDCYMDVMSSQEKTCDPWATYLSAREMQASGKKGVEALTESERTIYDYVREKGRATRDEIRTELGLSAGEHRPDGKRRSSPPVCE